MKNLLIKGENLDALKYLLEEKQLRGKIDLVYIDPPFATNDTFTITSQRASTISRVRNGVVAYEDKLKGEDFVEYIRERVVILHDLLSDRGSLYLHTDYKIGHYLKVMMDQVFGIENFRNDISRVKCNPKNFSRLGYGNIKDMILFYTKTKEAIWNEPKEKYAEKDLEKRFPHIDKNGRRYTTIPLHAPGESKTPQLFKGLLPPEGRHWRTDVKVLDELDEKGLIEWSKNGNPRKIIFADESEGKRVQDVWFDYKDPQYPQYPTEKNQNFIDLIVQTSSSPDSIVLDCFCGSGTTLKSASDLGRTFIGIDRSEMAISATQKKLGMDQTQGLFPIEFEYMEM